MPVEGRDLSSRQTQYVVKDLGDWATYQLRKGFRNRRWRCTRKHRRGSGGKQICSAYNHRATSRLYQNAKYSQRAHVVRNGPAGSSDRCNTSTKSFRWGFEAQSLAWPFI